MKYLISVFLIINIVFVSCKKSEDNQSPEKWGLYYPDYVQKPVYDFKNNPSTEKGFQLGRLLFYDPILSSDSTISCASCHSQPHAFADHNMSLSLGVDNKKGVRNSPAMFNLAWQPTFMWDGGINHIEVMPLAPITNHLEMNETIANVILKLNRSRFYKDMFYSVFNKPMIDDQQIFFALTQFMGNITSFNSKYDEVKKGKSSFTEDEKLGYQLFLNNCNSCHSEPLFSDFSFSNNGLDSVFKDKGRALITLDFADEGKFKVPSLRNIMQTNPYMHDGRFKKIQDVIKHYEMGITNSNSLDKRLSNPINFNETEKMQLILFLNTLTDYTFLNNPLYSEP